MPTGTYDAIDDLTQRYPGWTVLWKPLGVPELIYPAGRVVLLEEQDHPDRNRALAHAIVHLDLHLDSRGEFTDCQEAQAEFLADVRLDQHGYWAAGPSRRDTDG